MTAPDPAILAAIRAGHIGQVTIFCDACGVEDSADYTGETREVRFATARAHLAATKGWHISAEDLCPRCAPAPVDWDLLADVALCRVYHVVQRTATYDMDERTYRRCTRAVKATAAQGLIELGPPDGTGIPRWRLTDAGRAAIDVEAERRRQEGTGQ